MQRKRERSSSYSELFYKAWLLQFKLYFVSVKFDSACIISYTRIELRRLEVNIYRFASKQHITDSNYIYAAYFQMLLIKFDSLFFPIANAK